MFKRNLINYKKIGQIGKCPICDNNLEISEMKFPKRTNLLISCAKCNKKELYLGTYDLSPTK